MTMSTVEEATPSRKKKGDNAIWTDLNLIELKNKKNHTINLATTNEQ
jgi:hypothetical protein